MLYIFMNGVFLTVCYWLPHYWKKVEGLLLSLLRGTSLYWLCLLKTLRLCFSLEILKYFNFVRYRFLGRRVLLYCQVGNNWLLELSFDLHVLLHDLCLTWDRLLELCQTLIQVYLHVLCTFFDLCYKISRQLLGRYCMEHSEVRINIGLLLENFFLFNFL